ncbi:MAG: S-methyl-5'-thioinosine phosphorylase [Acidimicrobiales bacterium]|nr:S-methyl-5'-thioinosine phosphorylase [Acidimicrobiales bacterium]
MLAIITGSGFYEVPGLTEDRDETVVTPYGPARVTLGTWQGRSVAFLPRHGAGHSLPPHRINYRANIWALREIGASAVLATAVSGGIARDLEPGDLVLIDQFLEFTKDRADTFFDGDDGLVRHTDMTEPYHRGLRNLLAEAAADLDLVVRPTGTYVCMNGPRFETPAEIAVLGRLGAELVGMTGYPEVALAAEVGLPYASIGVISNPAAGLGESITIEEIIGVLEAVRPALWALIGEVARRWTPSS